MRKPAMSVVVILFLLAALSGCATWNAEKRAPLIGEIVDVGGEEYHLVDAGARDSALPPVVLIHGASVNLRDMKLALGDELAKTRRVIMIDRPGRGYSDRPEEGWRIDVQARVIRDAVAARGVERPVIVGQSLGGAVALAYALQYQEEMSGLVLLAPVSHEWPGGVSWYNTVATTPVVGFFFRRLVVPVYGALVAEKAVEASFEPDAPPPGYIDNAGLSLLFRPSDFHSNASDLVHLKKQIVQQQTRYGELTLPVKILTGTADDTVSPDLHSKALARQIPQAELTLLPDTGHALHHAETAIILQAINGF